MLVSDATVRSVTYWVVIYDRNVFIIQATDFVNYSVQITIHGRNLQIRSTLFRRKALDRQTFGRHTNGVKRDLSTRSTVSRPNIALDKHFVDETSVGQMVFDQMTWSLQFLNRNEGRAINEKHNRRRNFGAKTFGQLDISSKEPYLKENAQYSWPP